MLADPLKSFLLDSPPGLFIQDVAPQILQDLKDLSNTRLYYDGCNAGIRVGNGGIVRFYRNKYCNPKQAPPPLPDPEKGEHARAYCANGNEIYSVIASSIYGTVNDAEGNVLDYFLSSGTSTQVWADDSKKYGQIRLESVEQSWIENNSIPNANRYRNIRYEKIIIPWRTQNFTSVNLAIATKTPSGDITYITNGQGITLLQQFTSIALRSEIKFVGNENWYDQLGGSYGYITTKFQSPPCPPPPPLKPPPPPEPPKMDCCEELYQLLQLILQRIGTPQKVTIFDEDMERKGTQKADKTPQSLNEYLKLTTQRVEITNRLLGIDNYPMTVPDTMIEPFKDGVFAKVFKFIDGKKKRKINSVTELIAWMSEQDSAVLGEFHQVINFETEDKKTSSIVLPNVAEALKELVLLTSQMAKQNNTQTELIFKIAAEVVATKAVAAKGTQIAEDIQDYLDYPTERKTKTIPTAVSLPRVTTDKHGKLLATSLTESPKRFLKSGKVEFVYEDWTGSNSLHDQLLDLLQLAAMLRAIYYQRTDK